MSSDVFHFRLLAPTKDWFSGPVDSVHFATKSGEMEILPGHVSLVGIIDFSLVKIRKNGHIDEFLIRHGAVSIDPEGEGARIMAQDVQDRKHLDKKSLKEYLDFVTEKLKKPDELSKFQIDFLEEQKGSLEKSFQILEQK